VFCEGRIPIAVFYLDVAHTTSVYLDVAYVSHTCCKVFYSDVVYVSHISYNSMFHLCQTYVASMCFMLQMFHVASVL
jgi:hypothetical protein